MWGWLSSLAGSGASAGISSGVTAGASSTAPTLGAATSTAGSAGTAATAADAASRFGGGGGGGKGGDPMGGGMQMLGSLMSKGAEVNQKVEDRLLGPYRERRARVLEIAEQIPNSEAGIQPVSRYAGGAAMAKATAVNRADTEEAFARDRFARLSRRLRQLGATRQIASDSASILRTLASYAAGGGPSGGGGGGGI